MTRKPTDLIVALDVPTGTRALAVVEQLGELPVVHEAGPYPEAVLNLDRTFQIKNYKRGMLIAVTEEMIRFNRLNILKRHTARLGGAASRTRDVACYSVLTTAGNYTRDSTTGDNDIGANTAATTFSACRNSSARKDTSRRTRRDTSARLLHKRWRSGKPRKESPPSARWAR